MHTTRDDEHHHSAAHANAAINSTSFFVPTSHRKAMRLRVIDSTLLCETVTTPWPGSIDLY